MMRFSFPAIVVLLLSACATYQPPTPQQQVIAGCEAFARSVRVLAAARWQGRLNESEISSVNEAINVASPICLSPTPPVNGPEVMSSVNSVLESIIFQAQSGSAPL